MAHIRLALCSADSSYITRLSRALSVRYPEEFEVHTFSTPEALTAGVRQSRIHVALVDPEYQPGRLGLPESCAAAVLSEDRSVDRIGGVKAVCRYQSVSDLRMAVLSLMADVVGDVSYVGGDAETKVVTFVSTGSIVTVPSAAFAKYAAAKGKRVLLVSLMQLTSTDAAFAYDTGYSFDDVLYTIKSGSAAAIGLKLEGCTAKCGGVELLVPSRNLMEMRDVSAADIETLITGAVSAGRYDYIVLDCDFSYDARFQALATLSGKLVFASDGSTAGNTRLARLAKVFTVWDAAEDCGIDRKGCVLTAGPQIAAEAECGGMPSLGVIRTANAVDITDEMAASDVLAGLL